MAMADSERMDRFTSASVSQEVYPGMFFLRPKYKLLDNGASQTYAVFESVFYVLVKAPQDDWDGQDNALNLAEDLGSTMVKKLYDDLHGQFELKSVTMEPVLMVTLDFAMGYEVRCKLALETAGIFS